MLIRLRDATGTHRIEVGDNATLNDFIKKIQETQKFSAQFNLSRSPNGKDQINPSSLASSLASLNIKHGDIIFMQSTGEPKKEDTNLAPPVPEVEEDPIDKELAKTDGWIKREKDERMCKHGKNAKCAWCMSIAPWSILEHEPWKERIRWIPFHAYLKKMTNSSGCNHPESSRCLKCKTIEIPSYRQKPCDKHPPWPEGICNDCAPGTCSLDAQTFRHVDHMEIETTDIIDRFLQSWRDTRNQRCGYLYGRYVVEPNIPLGIRAVVSAIYEPPQKCSQLECVIVEDPDQEKVENLAKLMGLEKVGFIWTDLQVDNKGAIIPSRNFGDSPLKGQEILRMARMQNSYPNICKQAANGKLGSKFISALVTGNDQQSADVQVYQVSDQCMQLVKDGILAESEQPQFIRVKRLKNRFVPDIMFKAKDEYNNQVFRKAEPDMPLEFFIIKMSEGAPKEPNPTFKQIKFAIENRKNDQSLEAVKRQLDNSRSFYDGVSDFHLLVYLAKNMDPVYLAKITDYLLNKSNEKEIQQMFVELLKNIKTSAPATAPTTSSGKTNPKEQEWIASIVSMGFTKTQAQEALWATDHQSVEAALDFLFSQV